MPRMHPQGGPPRMVVHPALALLAAALIAVVAFNIVATGFERAGVPRQAASLLLLLSVLGSAVNIPLRVRDVPGEALTVRIGFMVFLRAPVMERQVLAVNLGGAVIPVLLSIWILASNRSLWQTALATVVVALVANRVSRRVPGKGIEMPAFIPPATAALAALVLGGPSGDGGDATAIAYAAGTLGTLIGADVLNMRHLDDMGPGVMSIGGAGVFDGVFLSGIVAAFLSW